MTSLSALLLLAVIVTDLYVVSTGRLGSLIRATALQGVLLALLPSVIYSDSTAEQWFHIGLTSVGTLVLKAGVIPWLLSRAMREANVRREAEPFVSLHASVVLGALLVALGFWMGKMLPLPEPVGSPLLVPASLSTILMGFLVLVSRKMAIAQVVGYLVLENGVFIFGLTLARALPFVVELGVLLDLLVGVFVMGIAIHHISREFDHIDTDALVSLRG